MKRFIWAFLLLGGIAGAWQLNVFDAFAPHARFLMRQLTFVPLTLPYPPPPAPEQWKTMPPSRRLEDVKARLLPALAQELTVCGLTAGDRVFIRIFKESYELELWMNPARGDWKRFRTYPIACLSGVLGPKQREGDMQAPEGFYSVRSTQLNPASSYHLAFNIGYPNTFDRHHQRTGSHIMVHGDEASVGCYAMTDPVIEEIYLLVSSALEKGQQEVPVHCFPFRFTDARMQQASEGPWFSYWENLREGFEAFEKHQILPQASVRDGKYVFR